MPSLGELEKLVESLDSQVLDVIAGAIGFSPQFELRGANFSGDRVDVGKVIAKVSSNAATKIQCAWRGHVVRRRVRALKKLSGSYHKLKVVQAHPALFQGRNKGNRDLYSKICKRDPDAGPYVWASRYYLLGLGLRCLWRMKGAAYKRLKAWTSGRSDGPPCE